jgi:hypothetical protein
MRKYARKVMAMVFWGHKDVLWVDFMEKITTIKSASYYATLESLRAAIRQRPALPTTGVASVG